MAIHASSRIETLAIIPARGGSKGIPRKNVRDLAGRPLIGWTIEAARRAQRVRRVVVSTDDDEIAAVATRYGAEVVRRPADLATDLASSEAALLHVLTHLREQEGYRPDVVAFLQCTSPLTRPEEIDGTVRLVADEGYDSAVTMVPFHHFVWQESDSERMVGVNHDERHRLMRQEREPAYLEVGAVYALDREGFEQAGFRFFGRIGRYLIPARRALEIDEAADWTEAEAAIRREPPFPPTLDLSVVRAVVTDFDGVLTDNRVHVDQNGVESVVCNRGDGWGIRLLKEAGLLVACISTEENPVVSARCAKLGIPVQQGQANKVSALEHLLASSGLPAAACLYIGNDTNDADCLRVAGVAVVPSDAAPEVVPLADWRTESGGGAGVLREVARALLAARGGEPVS